MRYLSCVSLALDLLALATTTPISHPSIREDVSLLTDMAIISQYWGQISPYVDNTENYFGVEDVGLPFGCQIKQAHLLQRHANRFPTGFVAFLTRQEHPLTIAGGDDDGGNDERFAQKITNFTVAEPSTLFTGPLAFLNNYRYTMGEGYLTGLGASAEVQAGVTFWNRYGRTLYNASLGQLAYNASFPDGTPRPKPLLRTTSQSRITNSEINWTLGFFGPSFQSVPDPTLANSTAAFDVVVIEEGGTENDTLASYDSCFNDNIESIGYIGDNDLFTYIPLYLSNATARLQEYAPPGFTLSPNDTYAMQSICAYESGYIGSSDFCTLFTQDEWSGFENSLDIEYFYDYAYGNPTGRAQGIGYLQELLARLQQQYIISSNSSVNSTLDDNPTTFPLHQLFYADFSHDDIIVSALTALSLDYFRDPPSLTAVPPDPSRHFILSRMTPFAGRLVTEVIGCTASNSAPVHSHRTQYYPTQYGYDDTTATYKFIRMRLNNGILPLDTIRGGFCTGRTDGLCAMDKFLESQQKAYEMSNYDYACFGNYTVTSEPPGEDYDGTILA